MPLNETARDTTADHAGAPAAQGAAKPGLAASSRTAEITAAMRAAETLMAPARRLFVDPYARVFLSRHTYRFLCCSRPVARVAHRVFDHGYGGLNVQHHLRNQYYDQRLLEAHRRGVQQIVMVGAGFDSLALRHDLEGATVFEVDAPPTQATKKQCLLAAGLTPTTDVVYVPCDFETDELSTSLHSHGFDSSQPAFAIFLGVSYYLSAAAVRKTLTELAQVLASGSELIVDYMDASVIDGTTTYGGARKAAKAVAARGEPYIFGVRRDGGLEDLVAGTGWAVQDNLGVADMVARFAPPSGVWCSTDDFMGVAALRPSQPPSQPDAAT
jgi:methyltransferase (TIGR00027 family)